MSAIMPFIKIDSTSLLSKYFAPYQLAWIEAEDVFHDAKRPVFALAEKSVRIGWTFCDGFKNVRKRLRFKNRDYLFATKDLPSALEYMNHIYDFADMFGYTRAMLSHGESEIRVRALDREGNPTGFTEEIKIGYIKFDNGSRILAFSSNPYAMAVYGGDVGLDEFAKHPNAKLLWETAQGRVTWGHDLAVWSSHDGEDSLFNQFAMQARTLATHNNGKDRFHSVPDLTGASNGHSLSAFNGQAGSVGEGQREVVNLTSHAFTPRSPWNLYFRVTMADAVDLGLVPIINRTKGTALTPKQFIADCQARAGSEEVFEQSYMCNPRGAASANIVEWSAIERCRLDYEIARVHLEHEQIIQKFGEFNPAYSHNREATIGRFLQSEFNKILDNKSKYRLGFDVAASGQGDLGVIYIDEASGDQMTLRALFTCRTEDWHFLKTVLFHFLRNLKSVQAAGDETGLGKQICWEASQHFSYAFTKVNFAAKKCDLGFALMNQLATAQKRFPSSHQDIAADYFALRKFHTGTRWVFTEARNFHNPVSHCDIAWAGALATHAHTERKSSVGCAIGLEDGSIMIYDGEGPPRRVRHDR